MAKMIIAWKKMMMKEMMTINASKEELEKEVSVWFLKMVDSLVEDILKNLKHDKNEDVAKGQAVKNQKCGFWRFSCKKKVKHSGNQNA
ncbi:hypothetical protein YC2023_079230 [Brassica napus]